MFKELDFSPGIIVYDDFKINQKQPFADQLFCLKEDLFQVNYYTNKYLIDIGWNPEFKVKGNFKIVIIKNTDWLNPLYCKKTQALKKLDEYVKECIEIIRHLGPKGE